jgi:CHAT domain-containing protein
MLGFHRVYLRTGDAPRALRTAQRALLESRDPALRTPALWAAFRYVGN